MKNTSVDNSATLYELNKNDFVVDWYGPDADGNWYRVYKSGWVEQGGYILKNTEPVYLDRTITFLKPYDSTPTVTIGVESNYSSTLTVSDLCCLYNVSNLGFTKKVDINFACYWVAMGQGA